MRTDLPTGVVSLLLTDIEGSTRLLHRLGSERYAAALATHRRLLRHAFTTHGGVEVDTQGDAFFIAFPDSRGAMLGAIDAQLALAGHDWGEGGEVKVRIGIHTGTPQTTDEGYVGLDVHVAARIASSGHGGQVLLSVETAAQAGELIGRSSHALRDLGEHRLKDVEDPTHIFQAVIHGLPSDFGNLRSLDDTPNNLPTYHTPFVGRIHLISSLRDLVLDETVRVVTLVGPGGTGKSRSSVRAAKELLHYFPDGCYFVPLAAVTNAAQVLPTIAAIVKAGEEQDGDLKTGLINDLREKQMLLVVDNFEQVQAAARDLSDILKACPRLKMIVTSREMLHVTGERVIAIPPLDLPGTLRGMSVDDIMSFEGVRLFVDRAKSVRADFALSTDNAATVVDICRKVDGLPLAIELAASRIQTMDPGRLLKAMRKRLKVLTGGGVDLLDHQRTLRDLIAWSYDLLNEEEQTLWRRLAVFAGGCTFDAAQEVCDIDDELDIEIDIDPLVAKSLVRMDFDGGVSGVDKVISHDNGPRINLLQTLRDYALEQLELSGELTALQDRHASCFAGFAREAEKGIHGTDVEAWLDKLDREQGNLVSALEYGEARNTELAGKLCASLWFYWFERGRMSDGRQWLEKILSHCEDLESETEARLLIGLTGICRHQGDLDTAMTSGSRAVEATRTIGDDELGGIALGQLGAILQRQGHNESSIEMFQEAARLLRLAGNRERLSFTLNALGAAWHITERLDEAEVCYKEAVGLGKELNDRNAVATASVNLGEVAQLRGDMKSARDYYRESLAIYASIQMKIAIAYCLEVIAGLALELEEVEKSARLFGHAEQLRREIDAPMESFNVSRYEQDILTLKTRLPAEELDTAWQKGSELSDDEAVAEALGISIEEVDQVSHRLMLAS